MKGFIYINQSTASGNYYVGSSSDPELRLKAHNSGRVAATKNKGPWVIKLIQPYPTLKEAKQVEYKLKRLKRKDYLEKMINDGFIRLNIK